jgi:hypothetical protein
MKNTKIYSKAESLAKDIILTYKDVAEIDLDAKDNVSKQSLPDADIDVATNRNLVDLSYKGLNNKFIHLLQEIYPTYNIINSGLFYYPPTGYMGWHTNSEKPCKRVYIVYSDGKSFFRYKDAQDNIVTDWDKKGVDIKEFDIPEDDKLWHCIYSEGNRVSIGFRLYDTSS